MWDWMEIGWKDKFKLHTVPGSIGYFIQIFSNFGHHQSL